MAGAGAEVEVVSEVEVEVGAEVGPEADESGMGGGTSSCTPRSAEGDSAAVCRAAPPLCVVDGGADL